MLRSPIQESVEEGAGERKTTVFRPNLSKLFILDQCKEVYDFDGAGQSKDRRNANRFYSDLGFGTSAVVQLIVGIRDSENHEFWNCFMENKNRMLVLENGLYIIKVKISPNGLVCFPKTNIKHQQLPNNLANIKCILPVENDPLNYKIVIKLFKNSHGVLQELDSIRVSVRTHESGHDPYEFQEGKGIKDIERPLYKIKKTGLFAEDISKKIITHFQNLRDKGLQNQFYTEKQVLNELYSNLDVRLQTACKDIIHAVGLEECSMLLARGEMEGCLRKLDKIIIEILEHGSPNERFLLDRAYIIKSAVFRKTKNHPKAIEYIQNATEMLEPVETGEHTSVNRYNYATLLADMEAKSNKEDVDMDEADSQFENSILHYNNHNDGESTRYKQKIMIGWIESHLRCSRLSYPDERKKVNEKSLIKVIEIIKKLEHDLQGENCTRHKVSFYMSKAHYYIRIMQNMSEPSFTEADRRQNAVQAYSILCKALEIAKKLRQQQEITAINLQMEKLNQEFGPNLPRPTITRVQRNYPRENDSRGVAELWQGVEKFFENCNPD